MKLGIVGLPNVGKSTLFNAITNAGAESANYPFCTIEPNVGVVAAAGSQRQNHHAGKEQRRNLGQFHILVFFLNVLLRFKAFR